jgi:DNA-binding MarR family transcriptional regulator
VELAQQLRNEIMGYFGAASDFDERVAKKLKLSRTDMRCLDLIGRLGPITAGRLAEESGLTTGAVTFILDRLEEAGMVTRRRDTEDRRRVWVEIVPEAQERLEDLQQPVADEMRRVAQRFKAEELATVRDFMRQAKEVFQRQVHDVVHEAMQDARGSVQDATREARESAREASREASREARDAVREAMREARETAREAWDKAPDATGEPPEERPGGPTG